ncbi:MAG: phenylacetate--CoA ligase family protein [Magnetococcales bacterium]|nr:phenylacetate--CoA ligase family protein [Magnetococcales bacterium]
MLTFTELLEAARRSPLYDGWSFQEAPLPEQPGDAHWRIRPTLDPDRLARYLSQHAHLSPDGSRHFLSSGTLGKPKLIPFSESDLERLADLCGRFSALEGINAQSRSMVLLPMASWTVGRITMDGHRRVGAQVHGMDLHGGVTAWQQACDAIRPTVISSTPSVLAAWAPHYHGPPMTLLETTGEPLLESERRLIEARFGAFVHDAYGLTECVVGVECAMRQGFHYWPDSVFVEILDPKDDRLMPAGTKGEIVLTSFQQGSVPILRYRSGDLGWLAEAPCPCGRREPLVHLYGRKTPALALPRGVKLDRDSLEGAMQSWGYDHPQVIWKGTPGSPALPFVTDHFRPTLEITWRGKADEADDPVLLRRLSDQFPELAELVHERVLDLALSPREGVHHHGRTA